LYHAEETNGIAPIDLVIGVRDHHVSCERRLARAHRIVVGAAGRDIVKDPLIMPDLLGDIGSDRGAQPIEPIRQAATSRHEKRGRVPHMMVGLGEERDVFSTVDAASQQGLDRLRDGAVRLREQVE
jgi:hypothetical protein